MLGRVPAAAIVKRRWILAVSLGVNLGLLGFFKYANLLTDAVVARRRQPGRASWRGRR